MFKKAYRFFFISISIFFCLGLTNGSSFAAAQGSVISYPEDSKVLIQWTRIVNATDYVIEYKVSSEITWHIFNDGVSTTPGVTVTGLINGIRYDFRVYSMMNNISSLINDPISAVPSAGYNNKILNQVLSTGQSLSLGVGGSPALTKTQLYNNKMMNTDTNGWVPLIEPITGGALPSETMSSAMANMLSELTKGDSTQVNSLIILSGKGGTGYVGLKKSTAAYENGIKSMNKARDICIDSALPYRVNAITVIHGELDEVLSVSDTTYARYLSDWQRDYEADAKKITGQDGIIPLFTDQMASWTSAPHVHPSAAMGQLQAARNNPSRIFLVTPKYIFNYTDAWHMKNYSYRRLGEYYGKVMKKVLVDRESWLPLSPACISITDSVIYARFHVPVPPLQFNTTAVMAATNYGFEYFDDDLSATIADVSIAGPVTVKITLNKKPTGINKKLAYAYTGISGSLPGAKVAGSARGNLCDSDPDTALYNDVSVPVSMGNVLRNWSVAFIEPINSGLIHDVNAEACNSYLLNGQTYTQSGKYEQVLAGKEGCDSVVHLDLTLNNMDTTIIQDGYNLTANEIGAKYKWIDCNDADPVTILDTNQSFIPLTNGNYALILEKNECSYRSPCLIVQSVSSTEQGHSKSLNAYPNPTSGNVTIDFNNVSCEWVEIQNGLGVKVFSEIVKNKNFETFDLSSLSSGIYILSACRTNGNIIYVKFFLQK